MIKDILTKINNAGFSSYLVGGFTRDSLLNIKTYDIDITTNATVEDLLKIFNNVSSYDYKYGTIKIIDKPYTYEITTFRKESNYTSHNELNIEFTNSKEEDSIRRDFTINSIYQDINNNIYDPYNGIEDLKLKIIRCIGNIDKKLKEDPLRILRCIRLSTTLDFSIEEELYLYIKQNPSLINNISKTRILEELTKILKSPNYNKGLKILKENNYLNYMSINYDKITYVDDIYSMYAQIDFIEEYQFTKEEKDLILTLKEIIKTNTIDKLTIFKYGLDLCLKVSPILNIDKSTIYDIYNNMNIKNINELNISRKEIHDILNASNKKINYIYDEIIELILNNKLSNTKEDIINYIRKEDYHERSTI